MRLFYVPKTRATRPGRVLEEQGVPQGLVRPDAAQGDMRSAEHLRIDARLARCRERPAWRRATAG
jgi:hypothetical protein